MEIGGWVSRAIFDRYAIIDEVIAAEGFDKISALVAGQPATADRRSPGDPAFR
jgi:hypothetical protein